MDFKLKDGREAHTEIWDADKLGRFLNGCTGIRDYRLKEKIPGFEYLQKNDAIDFKIRAGPEYAEAIDLSDLEKQDVMGLPNWDYHRTLAAICEGELAGMWLFRWRNFYGGFWRYQSRFMDIKDEFRNQGIGTAMVKTLHQADFIQGRIVECGGFSDDGERYIKKVIAREMTAENYALVGKEYEGHKPNQFGVYDSFGEFK
jgi:GNAT superfamily N-acetyltransferase